MYSGITRGTFEVTRVDRKPDLLTYEVELNEELAEGLAPGASVSIDGICQTVVTRSGNKITFDAIKETLDLTTLDTLELGDYVAVERSTKVGDEIGGHDVAGHVHGTGEVAKVHHEGDVCDIHIRVPKEWMNYIFKKGFIAVDGSSMTVGEIDAEGGFDLHLIPETLRLTNLGKKGPGDRVNIELDARTVAIVDTVERVLEQKFERERVADAQ